ncbi:MAG: tetratricopeptide repeat-containing protein [Ginsengibacter sp.]
MGDIQGASNEAKKRCFVVMGFGKKIDLATGRTINLDYSYNALIKPVVEGKGLECIRADEIKYSGSIDIPMYQELLTADVVVADLSTANPNAVYELGLRHALRPRTTIVISEQQLSYPFDLSHIFITKYKTLGDSIDYFEVVRFQKILGDLIDTVLKSDVPDSPVYTFLNDLIPPSLKEQAQKISMDVTEAVKENSAAPRSATEVESQTLSLLVKQGEKALTDRNFELAKALFNSTLELSKSSATDNNISYNPYLVQQLALATYKAKQPDEITALQNAINILEQLDLIHTNDTATVALAGKIEKRLYTFGQGDDHLRNAITYLERAYYLLNNRYHGINLSYLLNLRVNSKIYATPEDQVADLIWANRFRQEVLEMCERDMNDLTNRRQNTADSITNSNQNQGAMGQQKVLDEEAYYILINKAEAYFGMGSMGEYKKAEASAKALNPDPWVLNGYEGQRDELEKILLQYGHLLNPPWPK